MAARAVHRQTQKSLSRGPYHVVQIVVAIFGVIRFSKTNARPDCTECRGGQTVIGDLIELIARELLNDKLIVWLVFVEGLDHVVAIAPRIGHVCVGFISRAVCVPDYIEPVASPTFAITRGGQ